MATATTPDGTECNPFIMRQGKSFAFRVKIKNANGSAFDLTGYTGRAQMRSSRVEAASISPVLNFTITNVAPATGGLADVTAGATQTDVVVPGTFVFDVEFEKTSPADPDDVVFGGEGFINVIQQVTK